MNEQHVWQMLDGLGTSLQLTAASLAVGCILALLMTLTLILRTPGLHWVSRGIITLFTGTPLLVQIFWSTTARVNLMQLERVCCGLG